MSPLWGEKPIFGPVSKNNTGMAALRAGLPVITTTEKNLNKQHQYFFNNNNNLNLKNIQFSMIAKCLNV